VQLLGLRVLDGSPGRLGGAAVQLLGVCVLDGSPGRLGGAAVQLLGVCVLDRSPGRLGGAATGVRLLDRCPRVHFALRTSSLSLGSSGIFFAHATASSMLGTSIV